MTTRILLISDIHGNYPALLAIDHELDSSSFDYIINCGDSLVYAPFPNKTLLWLKTRQALSILGNTDKKILKLLSGKSFKKPRKVEKRIMYSTTADTLSQDNCRYLLSLPKSTSLTLDHTNPTAPSEKTKIGIFHGSPAHHHEFVFADSPDEKFHQLAEMTDCNIIVTGHSHSPYHKEKSDVHFINPGSVGRMFDGDPRASCATLEIVDGVIYVSHYRIAYAVDVVVAKLRESGLPDIYISMFRQGKKLN
ncbi:MAG: metallophosphoesterase family protein [Desulforhopalus sp.]